MGRYKFLHAQTSGDTPARELLAERILQSFKTSTFDNRTAEFLPDDCIDTLVTEAEIREELGLDAELTLSAAEKDELVSWIHNEAAKVFAITVQCEIPRKDMFLSMATFHESNFNNFSLPIDNPRAASDPATVPPHPPPFPTMIWTLTKLYRFYEAQWKCLAPAFTTREYEYNLKPDCILPFTWKDNPNEKGAFSKVYKVVIHPAHRPKPDLEEVAIKEICINQGKEKDKTEAAWGQEAMALRALNVLDHENIIKCIAAIRRGDSRYFMFPWADGGSLREFWEATAQQTPKADTVRQAITQLRGLADALCHLHNYEGKPANQPEGKGPEIKLNPHVKVGDEVVVFTDEGHNQSIRHGDLKPENILRFLGARKTDVGTLKLADMGLAKRHVAATVDRKGTTMRYGTIRYEAPETLTALPGQGRSRLYDIWSMGCITLEYIIWILFGNKALDTFYNEVQGESRQCFELQNCETGKKANVHPVVRRWMDHIRDHDPECSQASAIRDLLEVVRTKLLVIDLPPNRPSAMDGTLRPGSPLLPPSPGEEKKNYRCTAESFRDCLDEILFKLRDERYVLTGKGRVGAKPPDPPMKESKQYLDAPMAHRAGGSGKPGRRGATTTGRTGRADYTLPPLEDWEFPVDNGFAEKVLAELGHLALRPRAAIAAMLCDRCKNLNFWSGGFAIEDKVDDLQEQSKKCDLCQTLWGVCKRFNATKGPKVRFERNESTLHLTGSQSLPVLSIFRSPELKPPLPIQLGFPELLEPGTDSFFKLIRLWLQDCDNSHPACQDAPKSLPSRLIDVGTKVAPKLRLLEIRKEKLEKQVDKYVALSHPWGDKIKHPPFRTLKKNLPVFKEAIPEDQLPATFKDAVCTTRALGVRYLWIDSLCIIQATEASPGVEADKGDFGDEAKHMEDVFSGAYCVLAASRATGQRDGFLKPQPQREYLTLQRNSEKPFYICQPIDNFSGDVLEGSLNRRGWVLQERALARRTVFFAENQTYFECGQGVRCQTLAKTHNNMADLLGDPKFPVKAMNSQRGLRIRYFQDLYKQYSRLELSYTEDRSFAIEGLENRLRSAYGTKGGFGIFDDGPDRGLFHRSLLWQRGEDEPAPGLEPIVFAGRRVAVPSWSWMAYMGGIDYLDPEFKETDWKTGDIHPPWTRTAAAAAAGGGGGGNPGMAQSDHALDTGVELVATVRSYSLAGRRQGESRIIFDKDRQQSDGTTTQCVVVARAKDGGTDSNRRHYVLLVVATGLTGAGGDKVYKRVGAGHMLGKYIALDKPGTAARIR